MDKGGQKAEKRYPGPTRGTTHKHWYDLQQRV